jgi:hypothetical protein
MAAKSTLTGFTGTGYTGTELTYDRQALSHVRTYNWPPMLLNFWIFVMLLASCSLIGVFATFVEIQDQLELPIPWYVTALHHPNIRIRPLTVSPRYFPYLITVACLGVVFIGIIYWLIAQRRLLPAIVMIGAFMLFILWLVGLVMIAIQLFGPDKSIQSVCSIQVFNENPKGQTMETMAWLQQRNICTSFTIYRCSTLF